jgi:hypothetical protein
MLSPGKPCKFVFCDKVLAPCASCCASEVSITVLIILLLLSGPLS